MSENWAINGQKLCDPHKDLEAWKLSFIFIFPQEWGQSSVVRTKLSYYFKTRGFKHFWCNDPIFDPQIWRPHCNGPHKCCILNVILLHLVSFNIFIHVQFIYFYLKHPINVLLVVCYIYLYTGIYSFFFPLRPTLEVYLNHNVNQPLVLTLLRPRPTYPNVPHSTKAKAHSF